jgi:hypothetical protein
MPDFLIGFIAAMGIGVAVAVSGYVAGVVQHYRRYREWRWRM